MFLDGRQFVLTGICGAARRTLLIPLIMGFSLCVAVQAGTGANQAITITSSSFGFAVTLPYGWIPIPIDVISDHLNAVLSILSPQMRLAAAFERKRASPSALERPFCFMGSTVTGWHRQPTSQQFSMVIKAMSADKYIELDRIPAKRGYTVDQMKAFSDLMARAQPGLLHVDIQSLRTWRFVNGTGSAGESVRSLSGTFFLDNGNMIVLNCYADKSKFGRDSTDFAALYSSFREIRE